MDPSALDQSSIISPDSPHPAIYAEEVQIRHPISSMDCAWLMFERFVFRRDDDGASFPDARAAPIRANSITSLGDIFTVAVIPEEPPAVSRLYVKWPGGAGSATELVTTDKGLLLLRLTSDIKLSEGETDKYPYRQDYFICQSTIGGPPWLWIKRLPECIEPIVLRAGDDDITIDRRFHADTIGLCRLGNDEFAVVQLAKFFVLAEDKMGAELCVLRSAVWTNDWTNEDVSDIVVKSKWEVLSLPIRHLKEEFNDIRCWSIDAAITFGDSIVWVDYHQGGMLSYTPRDANFISYNRLPIDNRPRDSLPSQYNLEKYRSLCATGGYRDIHINQPVLLQLKFVDMIRNDGAFFGPIAPGYSFTITCYTFTPTGDQMWRKDSMLTSRQIQYLNSRDRFMPSDAVTMFPVLSMDDPNLWHFLVSEQSDRIDKLSVVAIDMLSKEIFSVKPYIQGAEDLDGEYADMVRHRSRLPRSFLPCRFIHLPNLFTGIGNV